MRVFRRIVNACNRRRERKAQPLHEGKRGNPVVEKAEGPDFDNAIKNLRDADPTIRRNAAKELGELRDYSAVPALIESLGDDDVEVQRRAVWALGETGDVAAVAPLINIINGGNKEIQIYARWSIWNVVGKCRKTRTLNEFEKEFDRGLADWTEKHPDKIIQLDVLEIKKEINRKKADFLSK